MRRVPALASCLCQHHSHVCSERALAVLETFGGSLCVCAQTGMLSCAAPWAEHARLIGECLAQEWLLCLPSQGLDCSYNHTCTAVTGSVPATGKVVPLPSSHNASLQFAPSLPVRTTQSLPSSTFSRPHARLPEHINLVLWSLPWG